MLVISIEHNLILGLMCMFSRSSRSGVVLWMLKVLGNVIYFIILETYVANRYAGAIYNWYDLDWVFMYFIVARIVGAVGLE
jgi:hypothetical protein